MFFHSFILSIILITVLVSLYNLLSAPYIENIGPGKGSEPKVSILIPARNEEENISNCLDNVLELNYKNTEVIVYNDQSTDRTNEILAEYAAGSGRIRVINGTEKPDGWTGKSWACKNLSDASSGELLLFLDADVTLSRNCLDNIVSFVSNSDIGLLSCFSRQVMITPIEWLTVPVVNWILLSLLPLDLVYKLPAGSLAAANGQFMLFKREDYELSGGHASVKDTGVDDIAFARLMKKQSRKVMTLLSRDHVSCRMYSTFTQSVQGLSKSFFCGFNMPWIIYLCILSVLFAAFFLPFILVFADSMYLIDIFLIILARSFISHCSGQNIFLNIVLHPLQILCMFLIGLSSFRSYMTGNVYWKGRRI